jgi:UDP-GlcNAc:undecaprenyl-phosphate GlcNAc-1-phosphate transferase
MVFPALRYAIPFACGLLFSLLLTPLARRAAFWLGAIDLPGERRVHSVPMPRFGGVVIYLAMLMSLLPVAVLDAFVGRLFLGRTETILLIAGATMVLGIGMLDDCRPVSPWIKLVVEAVAAAIVAAAGVQIRALFGIDLGWLSVPVSILWILTVVNGVNLIDGLDGLAVGASLISSATLFAVSLYLKDVSTALILAGLCGTLVGFLYYNFYPARLFLGDSGALLIGFLVSVVAIKASSKLATVVAVLAPALAVGLPLAEVILTTLRRTMRAMRGSAGAGEGGRLAMPDWRRAGLFTADREHIHHRLLQLGINHRTAVVLLYGVCLAFGIVAFVLCYQRIDIVLILAGAAAAGGALIPRLELSQAQERVVQLPFEDLLQKNRASPYVFLDFGLAIISWLAALLYNRSSAGPAIPGINYAGPWVVGVQMLFMMATGMYRGGVNRYTGVRDLLAMLKPLAAAAIGGWIALAAFRGGLMAPWKILAVDSYVLATLIMGSRFVLRVLRYLIHIEPVNTGQEGSGTAMPDAGFAGSAEESRHSASRMQG